MKLIDITHTLNEQTPTYPGDYKTTITEYKTIQKDYYSAYLLQSGLHTGTHIDIPMHLVEHNKTVKDFSVDCFIGNGVLLDVRGENPITMKDSYRDTIQSGDVVLLYTAFDERYQDEEYFNQHPTVGEELAKFLLDLNIKMLGMDMPAPDHPPYTFHKALLRKGIFVLENLTNLQSLVGVKRFTVMALPLKIEAEASFVRAVCIV